jgi:hypothetical protein
MRVNCTRREREWWNSVLRNCKQEISHLCVTHPRAAPAPLTPVLLLHYYTRSVSENIKGRIISCLILPDTYTCVSGS